MQLKPDTLLQGGKYRIIRFLGQGGFGITYEAEQVLLDRKVTVKEFFMKSCCERDEATSRVTVGTGSQRSLAEKFRGKFLREAQMIARMDHRHIIRVLDVFEENGTAYYVMDYLPGGSLSEKVQLDGPLSEAEAAKYVRQVADALAYIHSRNTVHLDVKPSNILLNEKGEAVLIDFGISKHYDKAGEQTTSTPVGDSKGYSPLEQSRDGDVSQFTPSTDIYALGATLYYLVSGIVPPEATLAAEYGIQRPVGISNDLWNAIEQSMKPFRRNRPQDIPAFLSLLPSTKATPAGEPSRLAVIKEFVTEADDETAVQGASPGPGYGIHLGHEWVDLGLPSGLKWATCNVGASSPFEEGDLFAWGETETKSEFTVENYRFRSRGRDLGSLRFSKYNTLRKRGIVDNKKQLEPEDDAARMKWGGRWRMPTNKEFQELIENCVTNAHSSKGGTILISKLNGRQLYLPFTFFPLPFTDGCSYWSSSLDQRPGHSKYGEMNGTLECTACDLYLDPGIIELSGHYRYLQGFVRPVVE